jgi:hypothetical protein
MKWVLVVLWFSVNPTTNRMETEVTRTAAPSQEACVVWRDTLALKRMEDQRGLMARCELASAGAPT